MRIPLLIFLTTIGSLAGLGQISIPNPIKSHISKGLQNGNIIDNPILTRFGTNSRKAAPAKPTESTLPKCNDWSKWEELGVVEMTYGGVVYAGSRINVPISKRIANYQDHEWTEYKIATYLPGMFESYDLVIDIYDGVVSVQPQLIPQTFIVKDEDMNPYPMYVADIDTYLGTPEHQQEFDASAFDFEKYDFQNDIHLMYYLPPIGYFGDCMESITLRTPDYLDMEDHKTLGGSAKEYTIPYFAQSDKIVSIEYAVVSGDYTHYLKGTLEDRLKAHDPELDIKTIKNGEKMTVSFPENSHGRFTIAAWAYTEDGLTFGHDFTRLYYMPDEFDKWEYIGLGTYTDDLVGPIYGQRVSSYEVEIEESTITPGLYRALNLYNVDGWPLYNYIAKDYYDFSTYTYFHCEDPELCQISETSSGIALDGNGEIILSCLTTYFSGLGYEMEDILYNFPGKVGTLKDNVISFPEGTPIATVPGIGYQWASGGHNTGLKLVLPGGSQWQPAEAKGIASESSTPQYYTLQGVRIAQPEKDMICIRIKDGKAEKIIF